MAAGVPSEAVAIVDTWRWDETAFVRAWEGGVFDDERVELVAGEVWPVTIGAWHGAVAMNIARALPDDEWRVTNASLPAGGSVPDPDVWVQRRDARPIARLGATGRLLRWSPGDVALVVEVSESSFAADTEIKTRVYGRAGFACYWVVHRGGVEVFTDPDDTGYRTQRHVEPDGSVIAPYADEVTIPVAVLLDAG